MIMIDKESKTTQCGFVLSKSHYIIKISPVLRFFGKVFFFNVMYFFFRERDFVICFLLIFFRGSF